MTGRARAKRSRLALAGLAACCAALAIACGPDYFEIPIETPIQPKMDVSPFQRVLVVGFVAGGFAIMALELLGGREPALEGVARAALQVEHFHRGSLHILCLEQ